MTFTFIIPVYNVEQELLRRCFDSLCALQFRHWTALVVDDGSTTVDVQGVVDALHDARFTVHRQENGGLSAARNTGLDLTTSEYIMFMDADDYVFASVVDSLVELIGQQRPDVLAFRLRKVTGVAPCSAATAYSVAYDGTGRQYMMHRNVRASACGYIFHRSLLDGGLRFTPGILHEDEDFTPRLWVRASRLIDTTAVAYAYYQRPHSIMHRTDPTSFARRLDDMRSIIRRLGGTGDAALQRRARILCRDMVVNILRYSPSPLFAFKQLGKCCGAFRYVCMG